MERKKYTADNHHYVLHKIQNKKNGIEIKK